MKFFHISAQEPDLRAVIGIETLSSIVRVGEAEPRSETSEACDATGEAPSYVYTVRFSIGDPAAQGEIGYFLHSAWYKVGKTTLTRESLCHALNERGAWYRMEGCTSAIEVHPDGYVVESTWDHADRPGPNLKRCKHCPAERGYRSNQPLSAEILGCGLISEV